MKFIEISSGEYLKKDEICYVRKQGEMKSVVRTKSDEYVVNMPCNTLLKILEKEEDNEVVKQLKMLNKNDQYFAG